MQKAWIWFKTKGWPWVLGVAGIVGAVLLVLLTLGSGKGRRVLERQVERRRQLQEESARVRREVEHAVEEIEAKRDEDLTKVSADEKQALEVAEYKAAVARKRAEEEARDKFQKDQPASDLRASLDELVERSKRERGS